MIWSVVPASAIASEARKFSPSPTPTIKRRALPRADHAMRLVAAKHGDRVGAAQPLDGLLHGLEQIAVVQVVDQMRDHFGVGLAFEDIAGGGQFGAQLVMVFDDAVVHQRDRASREKCGCALCETGAPCVAQRVWAMPVKPDRPVCSTCASRSATRAVLRARCSLPSTCSATPHES